MTTFRSPHYFAPYEKNMTLAINQRLAAKKDHHEAGMSALGGEIDQKIYPNYGMMSERIVIVEGTGK